MTKSTVNPSALSDDQPIIPKGAGTTGAVGESPASLLFYLLLGIGVGILFTKSEVISWFRIQEMFRFQSFHMYGVIGGAVAVAAVSVWIIKRTGARALNGARIVIPDKDRTPGLRRYWIGGTIFGLGWALLGACPGPMFTLIGNGVLVIVVAMASALGGTWTYVYLMKRLPH